MGWHAKRLCAILVEAERIVDTVGSWQLTAHPTDPTKTVVQYYVYCDPGPIPFGLGFIMDAMGKESLPKTLDALRARAAQKNQ